MRHGRKLVHWMTDSEKVKLIDKLIADFWEYNSEEDMRNGAVAMVTAILSVVEFGVESDG